MYEKFDQLFNNILSELLDLLTFKAETEKSYILNTEKYNNLIESFEKEMESAFGTNHPKTLVSIKKQIKIADGINFRRNGESYLNKINQYIIISSCSYFDNFLNEITRLFLQIKPSVLASDKKSISFYELIQKSRELIIESIIDKEVFELSYKRIDERIKYLSEKFELDIESTEEEVTFFSNKINFSSLIEIFAIRNIIVHNKGVVNKKFLELVPKTNYSEGEMISVNDELINNIITILLKISTCIFRQIEMRYN